MKATRLAILASLALALSWLPASAAHAQDELEHPPPGSVEIGINLGGYFFLDSEDHLKDTIGYGVAATYNITREFGVQFAFEAAPREVNQTALYQLHLDFIYHPVAHEWAVPFLGIGPSFAIAVPSEGSRDSDPGLNLYAGVDLYPFEYVGFRIELRYLARFASGADEVTAHDMLAAVGLVVNFGGERETGPVVLDTDGDGIVDSDDACPTVPGVESAKGCPDADGDTIADTKDKCPDVAGPVELDGCPDKDGDKIVDKDDRCPDKPGPAEHKGCPDTDKDQLADLDDRCPLIPGEKQYKGCPPPPPPEVVKKFSGVMEGITFEVNQAVIRSESFVVLDDAAKILNEYPHIQVLIEGHTSSEGARDWNIKLSKMRAESVKKYLAGKGVDEGRLETAGFGPDRPVADNSTEAGRKQNRRMEFKILRQ